MISLNNSPNYRSFVNKRDDALERILMNTQKKIAEYTDVSLSNVIGLIKGSYENLQKDFNPFVKNKIERLEVSIDQELNWLGNHIILQIYAMRRKTYLLGYLGEQQGIAIATGKDPVVKLKQHSLLSKSHEAPLFDGVDVEKKIRFELNKLKREIITAIDKSALLDDDVGTALWRVWKVFPKKRNTTKKDVLKRVRATEANDDSVVFNFGKGKRSWGWNIDPTTWDQILQDYKEDYTPQDRSPATVFDITDPFSDQPVDEDIDPENAIYGWEIERDVTHDFVKEVREGQIDAAKENGIDEFVWIAIIDERTCDNCCAWRNGLFTSEIEKRLDDEPDLKSYCDATVPPAHFNCRCSLAPASKDLELVDETQSVKDFDEWLNS